MKIEVSEESVQEIIEASRKITGVEPVGLIHATMLGSVYRREGLTPFYVLDDATGEVIVTSEEFMDNKFN